MIENNELLKSSELTPAILQSIEIEQDNIPQEQNFEGIMQAVMLDDAVQHEGEVKIVATEGQVIAPVKDQSMIPKFILSDESVDTSNQDLNQEEVLNESIVLNDVMIKDVPIQPVSPQHVVPVQLSKIGELVINNSSKISDPMTTVSIEQTVSVPNIKTAEIGDSIVKSETPKLSDQKDLTLNTPLDEMKVKLKDAEQSDVNAIKLMKDADYVKPQATTVAIDLAGHLQTKAKPGDSKSSPHAISVIDSQLHGKVPGAPRAASSAAAAPTFETTLTQQLTNVEQKEQWGKAFNERLVMMAGRGVEKALIRIDPPELGPIGVSLSMDGDNASLQFTAQHQTIKELIESQIDKLRDDFESSGLDLVDVSVSQQDQEQAPTPGRDHMTGNNSIMDAPTSDTRQDSDGLLDLYV